MVFLLGDFLGHPGRNCVTGQHPSPARRAPTLAPLSCPSFSFGVTAFEPIMAILRFLAPPALCLSPLLIRPSCFGALFQVGALGDADEMSPIHARNNGIFFFVIYHWRETPKLANRHKGGNAFRKFYVRRLYFVHTSFVPLGDVCQCLRLQRVFCERWTS